MAARDIRTRLNFHKGIFIRAAGFVLATVILGGALAIGSVLRDPPRAVADSVSAPIEQTGKDQTRVAENRPASKAASVVTDISVWHAGRMENAPSIEERAARAPAVPEAEPAQEWREQDFASITVIDGRTFSSGGVTITLSGLELPPPDQVCRTLDNRLEQCVTRAATQLELLTRSRTLACHYRMTTSSEGVGSCRIGSQDLAQRLVRAGYVRAANGDKTALAMRGAIDTASR
jgi:endonuclease YncB( thermonuclease family)